MIVILRIAPENTAPENAAAPEVAWQTYRIEVVSDREGAPPRFALLGAPLGDGSSRTEIPADLRAIETGVVSILLDGRSYSVRMDGQSATVDGERFNWQLEDPRTLRNKNASTEGGEGPLTIRSPMPGRVLRILKQAGEPVEAQQGLLVIEAMKMQNELKSPKAGRISKMLAAVGETVQAGQALAVVED